MTSDIIQRLARERAIQRLSPAQANVLTRPIRAGELDDTDRVASIIQDIEAGFVLDDTDRVASIIQDIEAGFVLAELTLEEARTFRPSGVEGLAGVGDRETAKETAR
jgi:hypothetical protein